MSRDDRTEEEKCDAIARGLRGEVVSFSVHERAQLPGLPDRRYYLRNVALWCEVKSAEDRLYEHQLKFLLREYNAGQIVFAGDRAALEAMLLQLPSQWRRVGHACLAVIVSRGFRKARAA